MRVLGVISNYKISREGHIFSALLSFKTLVPY